MARPKQFNRIEALNKAMEHFWIHGYQATSMSELRKVMGIGRQSLYDTFGDKHQLFSEVLAHYTSYNDKDVDRLIEHDDVLISIRSFFETRVQMLSSETRKGCLMMNTCMELSPHDPDIAAQIQDGLEYMQKGFEYVLFKGQRQGSISVQKNAEELAFFLTSQVAGMVVMAKNNASRQQLQVIADLAVEVLKPI